jgi:uncharacterized protein (TIGR03083 family)
MELATAERLDLARFLEKLTPQQWIAPTLCPKWRVGEVVAHTVGFDGLSPRQLTAVFLQGRLSVDRINAVQVAQYAGSTPEQLVQRVREHARPTGLASGFGGRIALTDNMIHHQDIRRALGLPRDIPAQRLTVALDFARWAPLIRGAWRARGLRLTATDLEWAAGSGPLVRGTGEALLMAMAARPAALADLDGPGVPTLARRIGRPV